MTIDERHKYEKAFFATQSPWVELKKDRVGTHALREFLGGLLYNHIRSEFPEVVKDIEKLAASTQKELELLGPARQTTADQRRFLTRLANAYQREVSNALSGNYDAELDGNSPMKLRMHVSKLSDRFAESMARSGHAKIFQDVHGGIDEQFARSSGDVGDIMDWIRGLYQESRGAELPGTVNPRVLENMFRQQSSPWKGVATIYIERIIATIQNFNESAFEQMVPDEDLKHKLKQGFRTVRRAHTITQTTNSPRF